MMNTLKSLAAALVLLSPLALQNAAAEGPHPDDGGALEHYHHEYYSHSFVDPNYHDDQDSAAKVHFSKRGRHGGKSNTGASIAFGGHRHHPK